jgi:glycerophosphoryl diester phosphodiesterase
MVWTVNEDAALRAFLADPRVDVLITDRPRRAVELRGEPHRTLPAGHLSS